MNTITFLTGNAGKLSEAEAILGNRVRAPESLIDLPEIQALNTEEIIEAKLLEAQKHFQGSLVVDDTSLYFTEWDSGKLPGPLIKFFFENSGLNGLVSLAGKVGREALVETQLGFFDAESGAISFFSGTLQGNISSSPRGDNGFGWDAIFEYQGKTFAEMTQEEKLTVSTRKIAFEKLREAIF